MTKDWKDFYQKLYTDASRASEDDHVVEGDNQYDTLVPLYETLCGINHRYENETLIGEGGWKRIYRVHDVRAARDVAMARPRPDLPKWSYDAFLREAHITAKLEHAHIIKLFDMGVENDGTPFFTMEFKRGQSLQQRLEDARDNSLSFPLSERLDIFLDVCDAISYAHSRGVLHLDLKPENIQVGAFGEVQVCDWGLGEIAINRGEDLAGTDALLDPDLYGYNGDLKLIKGTPGFMAPEQKKPGEPRTFQTDIYALGKTLAVLIGSQANPSLSAIVAKATAETPSHRYASVKHLRDDVYRFMTWQPTSVEPGGKLRETWLFVRRHQRSVAIAVIGLFVTGIVSAVFLTELAFQRRDQAVADARAQRALSDLEVAKLKKQIADAQAAQANDKATRATQMAEAMIDGRHQDAYDGSVLLMNVMGSEPFNGERTLEETIAFLNDAEKNGTLTSAQVKQHLGYAHFVAQRFDEAAKYYDGLAVDPDLQRILPLYQRSVDEREVLPLRVLNRLLTELGEMGRLSLIEQMMIYDSVKIRPMINEKSWFYGAKTVLIVVRGFNPEWSPSTSPWTASWTWNEGAPHLELWGKALTTLANTQAINRAHVISLLQPLQLKSLTLRDTGVEDLSHVASLNLWELTLVDTIPKSFEPLREMKSLRILKVNRPELQQQARAQLDKQVFVELIE